MQVDPITPTRWNEGIKRNRSTSPSSNKRRVPSNYTPSIYTSLPPHLVRSLNSNSKPGSIGGGVGDLNWDGLVLVTPDSGSPPVFESGDLNGHYMSQEVNQMDSDDISFPKSNLNPFYQQQSNPQPSTTNNNNFNNSVHSSSTHNYNNDNVFTVVAPHELPSLYSNLAGSPTSSPLSRSNNNSNSSEYHQQNNSNSNEMDEEMNGIMTDDNNNNHNQYDNNNAFNEYSNYNNQLNYGTNSGGNYYEETKKPKFSMGYRADCLKCVTKVPGHYTHLN